MLKSPDPHYPRYTARPLPPYRFIIGENPHPQENPQGHSYRQPLGIYKFNDRVSYHLSLEDAELLDPLNWFENEAYLFGVDLYNYAFWWEAHEIFEHLWRQFSRTSSPGYFFQGLIQVSGAFLKWHLKQQEGLEHLHTAGLEHLKFVCDQQTHFMGIALMDHIAKLSSHFRAVIADPARWPDPLAAYPFIDLHFSSSFKKFLS